MELPDKIEYLMLQNKIKNKKVLSEKSGVAYSTILSLFSKGWKNVTLPTIEKLSDFFNVSLDYLCDERINNIMQKSDEISSLDKELTIVFYQLNNDGKQQLLDYAAYLNTFDKYKKRPDFSTNQA